MIHDHAGTNGMITTQSTPHDEIRPAFAPATTNGSTSRDPDPTRNRVITVAVINDYEFVGLGVASMLAPYANRVQVVELDAGGDGSTAADVALFDTFAGRRHTLARASDMVR